MVHRDDARADALRSTGAQVIVGDLTRPDDVGRAIDGAGRAYFSMSVSPDYLEAAATFATVALDLGQLDAVVNMSQMTVSQMTSTSTDESPHQRLHYLAERILDWSGLPVVHIRPTVFLDNPFFTTFAARSIADSNTLSLPFGSGRTSPISAGDVARVVATILTNPAEHVGQVYELTGPRAQSMTEVAAEFTTALGRPVTYTPAPFDDWLAAVEGSAGIDPHVLEHLATMARLHAEGRYDRATETVQRLTGQRPQSVADFVTEHRARYDK
ncbi:MAG: hypothetical protein JWR37_4093 [Mycobacterium sp.]|nr:hypothetical protein [Mycobacterium sp.]